MDNLCHTLAGAALGEAGLKRRTALGMATLMIGANLPDVDVLAIPFGHGIDFRRGWTHGVLALVVLPFVLTALILAWDRWVRRRGGRHPEGTVRPRWVLALATLSILSHPALDWLNNYGVRWLMPFSGEWFYGDAVFIVDPWMWAALVGGVVAARRGGRPLPARLAVGAVTAYALVMVATAAAGRAAVQRHLRVTGEEASVMVGPVPVNPFRRQVVVQQGEGYRFGSLRFGPAPELELVNSYVLPVNAEHPAARAAADTPAGRRFLVWSRFPFFVVEDAPGGTLVRLDDARYSAGRSPSFAAVTVRVDPALAARPGGGASVSSPVPTR